MSDLLEVYGQTVTALTDYATAPMPPAMVQAWNAQVVAAYSRLCANPDFQLFLQDLAKSVLLNPEASKGERKAIITLFNTLRGIQQRFHHGDPL